MKFKTLKGIQNIFLIQMNTRKQLKIHRNVLKHLEIFYSLRNAEIDFLLENIRIKEHAVGKILYHENCHFDNVCLLVKGVVKQYKTGNKGKKLIIRFAKAGEIIGFRSYVSGELACSTTQVMKDASVVYINGSCLLHLMKCNACFSLFFIKQACQELEDTQTFIMNVAQKRVRERVAGVLIKLRIPLILMRMIS